jgi:hypothetical protein
MAQNNILFINFNITSRHDKKIKGGEAILTGAWIFQETL